MKLLAAGLSDVGRHRSHNEDSYLVDEGLGLLIVADGLGGHTDGEVASAMAVEVVRQHLSLLGCAGALSPRQLSAEVVAAVEAANRALHGAAVHRHQQRMATTIAVAWCVGAHLLVAHVGDSRIYLLRQGRLQRLTSDHSLVMEQWRQGVLSRDEIEASTQRNILTRAVGVEPHVTVDARHLPLEGGDVLLLCTDGLSTMVPEQTLTAVSSACRRPSALCRSLVDLANHSGGEDNITVVAAYRARNLLDYFQNKMLMRIGG